MLKSDHENKGKHKGHDNNEHSNAGDGKLKGLDELMKQLVNMDIVTKHAVMTSTRVINLK